MVFSFITFFHILLVTFFIILCMVVCFVFLCLCKLCIFIVMFMYYCWSGDQISKGARFSPPVQTGPGAHPASYTMGTGSFPGVKRPGRGVDHPPPSSAEVKERVDLYLYSPSGPSWPVIGLTLPFTTLMLTKWRWYCKRKCLYIKHACAKWLRHYTRRE
jgi:hypothetical protein